MLLGQILYEHVILSKKSNLESVVQLEKQGLRRRIFQFRSWSWSIVSFVHANVMLKCRGFRLPASHVIHTVGPIYNASRNPQALLRSAYRFLLCNCIFLFSLIYHSGLNVFCCHVDLEIPWLWQRRITFNILHFLPYPVVYFGKLSYWLRNFSMCLLYTLL